MIISEDKNIKETLLKLIKEGSSPLLPLNTGLPSKITKLKDIKSIVFDVYGTLFISDAGDISHSVKTEKEVKLNSILESSNFKILNPSAGILAENLFFQTIKRLHKNSPRSNPEIDVLEVWRMALSELLRTKAVSGDLTNSNLSVLSLRYELAKNPVWPMLNLEELLSHLQNLNLPMGIISNAQFFTPLLFEAFLGKELDKSGFCNELLAFSYEHKTAKPSRVLFKFISDALYEKFQITPGEVLYIGNDMLNDIKPAVEIGFKTALFAGDRRSLRLRENLPECNLTPDAVITDLLQIYNIIT
ncbi:MAG TPA: HAD family hydrolase [Lentisphaeria bacterium]|nr:MAG: hypothetical protein A2X47_00205 [Lentisphaerae bacterium GWF2_38_69]HBM14883.1 HAD family hydrolase [Lentisphaeria bacterium]